MTMADFISKIRRGRVSFGDDGPELSARAESLGGILADSLPRVISDTAEIHSGWQIGGLKYDWSGGEEM